MAIEFLPNQPILFESDTQEGLNNDTQEWSVLMQGDDEISIQVKNLQCGGDELACRMHALSDDLLDASGFTTFDAGWTGGGGLDYTHTGGIDTLYRPTMADVYANQWYRIDFEIVSSAGGVLAPFLGAYFIGTPSTGTEVGDVGAYTQYLLAPSDNCDFGFGADGDIVLKAVPTIKAVGSCWETQDYEYNMTADGVFCNVVGNAHSIVTNTTPIVEGYYVQVAITITNRSAGSVQVTIPSDTTSDIIEGNGTFYRYLLNPVGSGSNQDLSVTADASFDGCISDVVAVYMNNEHTFIITDENGVDISNPYDKDSPQDAVVIYRDTITWTISLDSVLVGASYIPLNTGCYRIKFTDKCAGSTDYLSVNKISYQISEQWEKTKMLEGTCSGEAFGFVFTGTGFTLKQRLPLLRISPKYETESEEYISSRGVRTRTSVRKEKMWVLWVDFIDETAHDTLSTIINCDTVTIDDVPKYFPTQDYEPEWAENQKYNLSQVKLDMKAVPSATYNINT